MFTLFRINVNKIVKNFIQTVFEYFSGINHVNPWKLNIIYYVIIFIGLNFWEVVL